MGNKSNDSQHHFIPQQDEQSPGAQVTEGSITRRTFLGAGALLTGFIAFKPNSPNDKVTSETDTFFGAIEQVELPDILIIRGARGVVKVKLLDTANIRHPRSKEQVGLSTFIPGDDVVAEGHWAGNTFSAKAIVICSHTIEARIVERTDSMLLTTVGVVQLTPDTRAVDTYGGRAKPLGDLKVGDEIVGFGWKEPASGEYFARMMSVRA